VSISRNYLHALLELMKSMGKSWQCIDLQVKYGKVCTLWYDAVGSSGQVLHMLQKSDVFSYLLKVDSIVLS